MQWVAGSGATVFDNQTTKKHSARSLLTPTQVVRFRFRYVLHPWTAKYSHWMWH
jgi:hypothetical protein